MHCHPSHPSSATLLAHAKCITILQALDSPKPVHALSSSVSISLSLKFPFSCILLPQRVVGSTWPPQPTARWTKSLKGSGRGHSTLRSPHWTCFSSLRFRLASLFLVSTLILPLSYAITIPSSFIDSRFGLAFYTYSTSLWFGLLTSLTPRAFFDILVFILFLSLPRTPPPS